MEGELTPGETALQAGVERPDATALRDGAGLVLEQLPDVPGGRELASLGREREDLALVGGAVRDLLLERLPRELDVVSDDDPGPVARELALRLGVAGASGGEGGGSSGETTHERFGTAALTWDGGRIDVARRRAESYPAPGALPEVRPGTVEEDLARRDFSVNAIAIPLGGPQRGVAAAVDCAFEDLAGGRLRVLHDASFLEDPTRLMRLARYQARLSFEVEERTAALAREAVAAGALATVSRPRIGAELRLALAESEPLAALAALDELGLVAAIDPRLALDQALARRALELLPDDGDRAALLLAVLLRGLADGPADRSREAMLGLLDPLEHPAGQRDRAIAAAISARELAAVLAGASAPSELHEALATRPAEAAALAGAVDEGAAQAAASWLEDLRGVRLEITGEDLLAAGVPPGPEVGRLLGVALRGRLDGKVAPGRDAELAAALGARR